MSALWGRSVCDSSSNQLKVLLKELNTELCSELLKFEASKILGEDIGSVIFRGDEEHIDLPLSYALMHVMILNINMFHADFLHRIRPNKNAALIVSIHWYRLETYTKFEEYIAYPAQLSEAIRQCHIFCLCRGVSNSSLCSRSPCYRTTG